MQVREETEATLRAVLAPAEKPSGPPLTLWTRALCLWFWVWVVIVMIPMSIVQLVTHRFNPTARNFKRNASLWGKLILRGGAGIRVRVTERARLDPAKPYVFVANHQNSLDIMALTEALPYPFGFVAKAELANVPFLGLAIRHSASVFLDRSDPRRSVESLKAAGERIRSGNSVLVFPEGSRSHAPRLLPLKKGAFAVAVEAGVPLVPVTILGSSSLMNEKRLAVRPGELNIVVGAPISMEGKHRRDIPEIMAAVEAAMNAELEAANRQ